MSAAAMNENLNQLTISIVVMVFMALVLTGLLWFVSTSTLTKPILELTRHAKDIAQGNFEKVIEVRSNDEIGQLTDSFNQMARELNLYLSTLALEKSKHEAVLHNMTDGVLAYDSEGAIIHANNASSELLRYDDLSSVPAREMLARLGFDIDAVYALAPDSVLESALVVEGRHITACCSPYTNQSGAVDGFIIVLQDTTKHARLDTMRRDFVANVSHELRTPLTSVRSYTETLMQGALGDAEKAHEFLRVIDAEAKRMSLLVSDLLELSRLDDNSQEMDMDVVDLVGQVQMAVKQSLVIADEKKQRILFDAPAGPYYIEANPGRLNQVIVNILSNSVKYSPPETDIEITMEETDKFCRVFIRDHGIGIGKDDLPRIFERFYRVDKGRSRAMGGTGLGLAIAKEIMEAHNGRIMASSEPGKGTKMVLRFNKYVETGAV
jgi:two-component system sensor histidine kinase VicK